MSKPLQPMIWRLMNEILQYGCDALNKGLWVIHTENGKNMGVQVGR